MKVTDLKFLDHGRELHLTVKPYKNGCRCPQCKRWARIVASPGLRRSWEDLTLIGIKILLWLCPREIECPMHGRLQELISRVARHARITDRLRSRTSMLCRYMTQKAAAEILHVGRSTASDLLDRIITARRDRLRIRGIRSLGADEISYCKGCKFVALVYGLERDRAVWVGPGEGRQTIDQFFTDALSEQQRHQSRWASCEGSRAYIDAIMLHCSKAARPRSLPRHQDAERCRRRGVQ